MVVQNCVYERTMTVTYDRVEGDEEYSHDAHYLDLKHGINTKLYELGFPLVRRWSYNSTLESLPVNDYISRVEEEEATKFTICCNDEVMSTTGYRHVAEETMDLLKVYSLAQGLADANLELQEITTKSEKVIKPSLDNSILVPYALLLDNESLSLNNDYTATRLVIDSMGNEKKNHCFLSTKLTIGLLSTILEFTVTWDAPVKSTTANITKHLVEMPEMATAKIMNIVEKVLNTSWNIDDDKTTIDCVTQSNINTKAECSPSVISSLKKIKAEL